LERSQPAFRALLERSLLDPLVLLLPATTMSVAQRIPLTMPFSTLPSCKTCLRRSWLAHAPSLAWLHSRLGMTGQGGQGRRHARLAC
jgi:hypothetical protein